MLKCNGNVPNKIRDTNQDFRAGWSNMHRVVGGEITGGRSCVGVFGLPNVGTYRLVLDSQQQELRGTRSRSSAGLVSTCFNTLRS
jgi:hypothetical protein